MRRGTPRRSEQNQSFDEEIGKIPEQLPGLRQLPRSLPLFFCRGFLNMKALKFIEYVNKGV